MAERDDDHGWRPRSEAEQFRFERAVADALARQIDNASPLPTEDRIRHLAREEAQVALKALLNTDEVRRLAKDEARDLLGSIGLDVSDMRAQAATAAEIGRWRETQATIKSVAMKILLSAAAAIGGSVTLFTFWKK